MGGQKRLALKRFFSSSSASKKINFVLNQEKGFYSVPTGGEKELICFIGCCVFLAFESVPMALITA